MFLKSNHPYFYLVESPCMSLSLSLSLPLLLCLFLCLCFLLLSAVRCIAVVSIDQMASPLIFSQIISFLPMHPRMRYSTVQYVALRCGGSSRHRKSSAQSVILSVCLSISFSLCLHISMSVCQFLYFTTAEESLSISFPLFFSFLFSLLHSFLPPSPPPSPLD